jgi:hypothetical protein
MLFEFRPVSSDHAASLLSNSYIPCYIFEMRGECQFFRRFGGHRPGSVALERLVGDSMRNPLWHGSCFYTAQPS